MEELSRKQKQILLLLLLAVILGAGSLWYKSWPRGRVEVIPVRSVTEPWPGAEGRNGRVTVHVCGAVVSPGVYQLPAGSRVYEALEAAGGVLGEADSHFLNLAAPVGDGERIYIPPPQVKKAQAPETGGEKPAPVSSEPAGSTPGGPAPVKKTEGQEVPPEIPSPVAKNNSLKPLSKKPVADGSLDVNRASREELEAVPGIGPVLAGRIIEYREKNGGFNRIDDLLKIKGIGPKTLEKLRRYLAVGVQ